MHYPLKEVHCQIRTYVLLEHLDNLDYFLIIFQVVSLLFKET